MKRSIFYRLKLETSIMFILFSFLVIGTYSTVIYFLLLDFTCGNPSLSCFNHPVVTLSLTAFTGLRINTEKTKTMEMRMGRRLGKTCGTGDDNIKVMMRHAKTPYYTVLPSCIYTYRKCVNNHILHELTLHQNKLYW